MICYRDMTFCTYHKNCQNSSICSRALTPEIEKKADEWWESVKFNDNGGAPICVFADAPECYEQEMAS